MASQKMVYQWHPDARVTLDAQIVGEHLAVIAAKHRGMLTPEAVLVDAKAKRSPLHSFFEWDDSVAATKYRLDQARYLVRHLVAEHDDGKMPTKPIRAFVHVERVKEGERKESGYMAIRDALSDDELRKQLLGKALSELKAWQVRYTDLRELGNVFEAIDQVELEFTE